MLQNIKLKQTILGLVVAGSIYLTFAMSTIAHGRMIFWIMHILVAACTCFASGVFYAKSENSLRSQIENIHHFMMMVSVLTLLGSIFCLLNGKVRETFVFEIISQLIFCAYFAYFEVRLKDSDTNLPEAFRLFITENKWVLLLCAVGALLSYDPNMMVFKYDGMLYYETADSATFYSLSSLAYYGHMSQGAALIITFFVRLFAGNTGIGIWAANVFAMSAGALFFYKLLKKTVPLRKELLYILLTSIYVFSPFVLGMSSYLSMDFYCTCLVFPVLYYTVSEEWVLQILWGAVYACTKEPGIIIYGSICLCVLIADFIKNKWNVFKHSRYYGMAMVAALWLVTLMFIGIWNAGDSTVGADIEYTIEKIEALFILNFTWIFVVIASVGYVFMRIRGDEGLKQIRKSVLPIFSALLGFFVFSVLINTVNHARYTDISPICIYLLASIFIAYLADKIKEIVLYPFVSLMVILMLLSSYFTFDPISIALFSKLKTDNGYLLSMTANGFYMGDHMLYNRQGLYLEGAYSAFIEDALDNDYVMVIPAYSGSTYYFDGLMGPLYMKDKDYLKSKQHWDGKKHRRLNITETSTIPYEVYSVDKLEGLKGLMNDTAYYDETKYAYAWVQGIDDNIADEIEKELTVLERKQFKYRGWTINEVVFN